MILTIRTILLVTAAAALIGLTNGFQPTNLNTNNVSPRTSTTSSTRLEVSLHNGAAVQFNGASNSDDLIPMRRGSSVALVTPMTSTGDIDLSSLEKLLEWHLESGTDNLCILGTTGEANTLSMKEREAVLKTAVKVCKGKMPILAGCGTIDPNHVKEMTMQAIDLGCDANLVVTPYYVKPPQRALIKHFVDTANLGLPVVVYNVPGRTGVDLADESMALLAQHENIVGLKDATGDLNRLTNLRQLLNQQTDGQNLLIYSGDDGTSMDFACQGGDGCISVTANVAPTAMQKMMQAAFAGETDLAAAINDPIKALHSDLFCEANPIPVKWAVARQGRIPSAYCRPPLDALADQYHSNLEQGLRDAGVLDTDDILTQQHAP